MHENHIEVLLTYKFMGPTLSRSGVVPAICISNYAAVCSPDHTLNSNALDNRSANFPERDREYIF